MQFKFAGFTAPNGTFVPDDFFDILMPELGEAELRVLLYIMRRTFGFKKTADDISLKQMTDGILTREGKKLDRGTGLSKAGNARGIRGLVEKGVIVATRNRSVESGDQATTYALRFKKLAYSGGGGGERPSSPQQATPKQFAVRTEQIPHQEAHPVPEKPMSMKETGGCLRKRQGGVYQVDTQDTVWQQTNFIHSNIRKGEPDFENKSKQTLVSLKAARMPASHGAGPSSFEGIDSIVQRSRVPAVSTVTSEEAREAIAAYIADAAKDFNDQAPLASSTTRAYNLYEQSSLSLPAFLDRLFVAKNLTKEHRAKKKAKNGSTTKMAYFFTCLEDKLGLRRAGQGVGERGTPKAPAANPPANGHGVPHQSAQSSPLRTSSPRGEQGGNSPPPHTHSFTHPTAHAGFVQSGQSSVEARSASAAAS